MPNNNISINKNFRATGTKERSLQSKIVEVFDSELSDRIFPGKTLKLIGEEIPVGYGSSGDRKIDLLALDDHGQPVIIELKRSEDRNHDLQAFRYGLLLQKIDRKDIENHLLRFRNNLIQLEYIKLKPTRDSVINELNDLLWGVDFKNARKQFSLILISENFNPEVLYVCNALNELNICHVCCLEFRCPSHDELHFIHVNLKKSSFIEHGNNIIHDEMAESTDDILKRIDDLPLRVLFADLISKYKGGWQPNNKRLVIEGPANNQGKRIKWRISQSANRLGFRQNNIIDANLDLEFLRSIGFIDVAYSKNKNDINAKIENSATLRKFLLQHNL